MTTLVHIDRAALEAIKQRMVDYAFNLANQADTDFDPQATINQWAIELDAILRAAPAGEQAAELPANPTQHACPACGRNYASAPPAEEPVAWYRSERDITDEYVTIIQWADDMTSSDPVPSAKDGWEPLYAHPPAPRGVTEEMVERGCEAYEQWADGDVPDESLIKHILTAALGGESEKPTTKEHTCYWYEDSEESAIWVTECGRHWAFTEGSPQDNEAKFCMGCGKRIEYATPSGVAGVKHEN